MKKKNGYSRRTGLAVCIPCFLAAALSAALCLRGELSGALYYLLCGVLTFSLTFGLVTAAHTDWEKKDG
ncbi:MAG: hypothetical protein VB021_02130 [Oscillospiraceae bacterium]|nr:hypothetical protein [Oscillospiraceae bacterium]